MPRSGGGRSGGRSASPSRGFGGRSPSPVSSVPARAPPRAAAPPPPPPTAVAQPQQRQPGMFAQMATTAAGVAVGSAVGHTIGAAMTGGMGGRSEQAEMQPAANQQAYSQPADATQGGPCQYQMKQFMDCAQTQHDITLCQGFNEALRECRMSNGIQM